MRVSLFATCLADRFFAEAAADAVRLLRSLDVDVVVPPGQTCCGQPAFNTGRQDEARRIARHIVRVFAGKDPVVMPSGSCAAMLRREYPELLPEGRDLASRAYELAEFLVKVLGVRELGGGLRGQRLAYHPGCHALRGLGAGEEPVTLLEGAGAEVVPWDAAHECCGFGGLFSVKFPAVSVGMADRKLDALPPVDALVSGDGGCLLHLGGRARRLGRDLPVRHLASVLWEGRNGGS
ncbi:MAG TPA: (Fe-S)-binding protein [Longimicrobiales bacterium]|jgi:L-lactate dehydrogenase complex protein LldE